MLTGMMLRKLPNILSTSVLRSKTNEEIKFLKAFEEEEKLKMLTAMMVRKLLVIWERGLCEIIYGQGCRWRNSC